MADVTPLPPSAETDPLIGRKVGVFSIEERIGEGGMGIVYRAVDETLRRPVALKVLPPDTVGQPKRRARLIREAQSLAAVTHPNIATVYAVGEQDDVVYIAMELVDGSTLSQLQTAGRIPIDRAAAIALDVARALAHAHDAGMVHRDLKPSNIMIGRNRIVKLLDFGLAKLLDPEGSDLSADSDTLQRLTTAEGAIVGTPMYMSPEQARGQAVDARSDVFSFGSVLYEMLTGELPFRGETPMDVLHAVAHVTEAPLRARVDVPPELARIAHKCLAKNRDLRYQDSGHLVADLEAYHRTSSTASGSSPGALLDTRTYDSPAGDTTRTTPRSRHPVWLALAAMAAAAIAAGAWLATRGDGGSDRAAPAAAPRPRKDVTARALTRRAPDKPSLANSTITSDGKYIVFGDVEHSWVRLTNGGTPSDLPLPAGCRGFDYDGMSSPTRVLAACSTDGTTLLVEIDLDRREVVSQLETDVLAMARISPDDATVAVVGRGAVTLIDRASGQRTMLSSVADTELIYDLKWSPDGNYLALVRSPVFARSGQLQPTLEVIHRDGSSTRRVLTDDGLSLGVGAAGLEWLASGDIVYSLGRDIGSALYRQPMREGAPAGEPSLVYELPDADAIRFSATDRALLITTFRSQTDAYLAPLEAEGTRLGAARRLTSERGLDWANDWTADGRIVLESDRFGTRDVYSYDYERDVPVRLYGDVPRRRNVVRAADDLLFWQRAGEGDKQIRLVRAPLSGGETTDLFTTSTTHFPLVRCAGSTTTCLLGETARTQFVLRTLDPKTGALGEPFYRRPASTYANRWDVSPDGASVAMTEGDAAVVVVSVPAGVARTIPSSAGVLQYVAWSADGSRLYVSGMGIDGNPYAMATVDLDGHWDVIWKDDTDWVAMPVPSPDGTQLAFNIRDWDVNLWLLEGL